MPRPAQFYGSYGFTEAYRRRAYYQDGEDALVLVLPLVDPRPLKSASSGSVETPATGR